MCPESGFWMAANWPKIEKKYNNVTICWHGVIANFFLTWSKFHFNIMTVCGVMAIFISKGLTRNPEIWNISVWFLPNICWLGRVRDTKFGTSVSNKTLLNTAKYSFYHFWVIKGKPTGARRGVKLPAPTHIGIKK